MDPGYRGGRSRAAIQHRESALIRRLGANECRDAGSLCSLGRDGRQTLQRGLLNPLDPWAWTVVEMIGQGNPNRRLHKLRGKAWESATEPGLHLC